MLNFWNYTILHCSNSNRCLACGKSVIFNFLSLYFTIWLRHEAAFQLEFGEINHGPISCRLLPKTSISWKSIWIYLKSQIEFWNFIIWFKSEKKYPVWNFISNVDLWSGSMCMYSTLSHDKLEHMHMAPLLRVHVWNKFSDGIKKF